jgi:hypothetical protein
MSKMEAWIEFIKAIIRPFIIVWGFIIYGVCVMTGVEVPVLLAGLMVAVIIEYFGERAIFRLRENSGNGGAKGDK